MKYHPWSFWYISVRCLPLRKYTHWKIDVFHHMYIFHFCLCCLASLHVLQSKYKKDKEDLSCTLHSLLPETLETQFVKEMALTHSEVGKPCVCVCLCVFVFLCVSAVFILLCISVYNASLLGCAVLDFCMSALLLLFVYICRRNNFSRGSTMCS